MSLSLSFRLLLQEADPGLSSHISIRFRKNLKQLYIVHPTFFTRTLVQFISAGAYFVSPKFARKIIQLPSLSALALHVPLTQIDVPVEVLQVNSKVEKKVTLPTEGKKGKDPNSLELSSNQGEVFGLPLEELMGERGEKGGIPRVVRDCVELLKSTPSYLSTFSGPESTSEPSAPPSLLDTEGLFRRSPSSALLKTAQESYDRGHPVHLAQYKDPHVPAVLLKVFLRSLPDPIFPSSLYPMIRACPNPYPHLTSGSRTQDDEASQEAVEYVRNVLLPAIDPPCSLILLSYVLELLHSVSLRSNVNRMDAANLATVFAPNLVSGTSSVKDMQMCRVEGLGTMGAGATSSINSTAASSTTLGTVIKLCIERYYEVFDQIDFEPPMLSAAEGLEEETNLRRGLSSPVLGNNDNSGSADGNKLPSLSTSVSTATIGSGSGNGSPEKSMNTSTSMSALGLGTPNSISRRSGMDSGSHAVTPLTSGKMNASEWTSTLPRRGGHRRLGSTGSSIGGASAPTSPRMISGNLPPIDSSGHEPQSPSTAQRGAGNKSLGAGSENQTQGSYRVPGGNIRNSSGSLRLTKGRLGSSTSIGSSGLFASPSSPTLANSSSSRSIFNSTSTSELKLGGADPEHYPSGLTGTSSGVALTGANASGFFASPSRRDSGSSDEGGSVPPSPSSQPSSSAMGRKRSGSNTAAQLNARRNKGLSEVYEE